jgi:hypothetical protein
MREWNHQVKKGPARCISYGRMIQEDAPMTVKDFLREEQFM